MARSSAVLLFFLVAFAALASCLEGRRLLNVKQIEKRSIPALGGSLILGALPKDPVLPSSTPSKKGHAVVVDEKLIIARHLISIDRILQSVPSPGVGH